MKKTNRIITLTGPSGTGKTTLAKALLKLDPSIKLIRSYTTRTARPSDLPGEYACDQKQSDFDLRKSEYLWIITAHGNTYATRQDDVTQALKSKSLSLMILVPKAVALLRAFAHPDVVSFFILPPNETVLQKRLVERGDDKESIERRINDGKKWHDDFVKYNIPYFKIDNDIGPMQTAASIRSVAKIIDTDGIKQRN